MISVGRDMRELSHVQRTQEGMAAAPTIVHRPFESQAGPVAVTAATKNVPATMYPAPSRKYDTLRHQTTCRVDSAARARPMPPPRMYLADEPAPTEHREGDAEDRLQQVSE